MQADPTVLNQLADLVQKGAKAASPKRRRTITPWQEEAPQHQLEAECYTLGDPHADESAGIKISGTDASQTEGSVFHGSSHPAFQTSEPHMLMRNFTGGVARIQQPRKMIGKARTRVLTKSDLLKTSRASRMSSCAESDERGHLTE